MIFEVDFQIMKERIARVLGTKRCSGYPVRVIETKTQIDVYLVDLDNQLLHSKMSKSAIEAEGMEVEYWKSKNNLTMSNNVYPVKNFV